MSTSTSFRRSRTCYDHLAGETAVRIVDGMIAAGWLTMAVPDFHLTRLGERELTALGIDLEAAHRTRRRFARVCIDLTERRPHLAGALGAALLDLYFAQGWIERERGSRAVRIMPEGDEGFSRLRGLASPA